MCVCVCVGYIIYLIAQSYTRLYYLATPAGAVYPSDWLPVPRDSKSDNKEVRELQVPLSQTIIGTASTRQSASRRRSQASVAGVGAGSVSVGGTHGIGPSLSLLRGCI